MMAACITFFFFTKVEADLFENITFPFRRDPAGHIKNPLITVAACYTCSFFNRAAANLIRNIPSISEDIRLQK